MEWLIYCFEKDSSEVFYFVLNFLNNISLNANFSSIFSVSVLVGFIFVAIEGIATFSFKRVFSWIMTFFLTMSFLLKIQVDCRMKSVNFSPVKHFTAAERVVKAPLGVVVPLSILTTVNYNLGLVIAKSFPLNQAAGQGFLQPLRELEDSLKNRKADPVTEKNFKNFCYSCVLKDISTGFYQLDDISKVAVTDDLSELRNFFSNNSSRTRKAQIEDRNGNKQYISCHRAFSQILSEQEIEHSGLDVLNALAPAGDTSLATNLSFLGSSLKRTLAASFVKNIFLTGLEGASFDRENSLIYAQVKGNESQKNYFMISGMFLTKWLPSLHTILLGVFSASFPLIVLCAAFPGGISVLKNYFFTLTWVSSWYPLFVIVHMIMLQLASQILGSGATTIFEVNALSGKVSDMLAMSGYVVSLIPMLSIALVKGAGQAMGLSHAITGAVNQSAGHISEEVTSGNISLGNVSIDNHSFKNNSSYNDSFGNLSYGTNIHTADTIEDSSALVRIGENGNFIRQEHRDSLKGSDGFAESTSNTTGSSVVNNESVARLENDNEVVNINAGAGSGSGPGFGLGGSASKSFAYTSSSDSNFGKSENLAFASSATFSQSNQKSMETLKDLRAEALIEGYSEKEVTSIFNRINDEQLSREQDFNSLFESAKESNFDDAAMKNLADGKFSKGASILFGKIKDSFNRHIKGQEPESMPSHQELYKRAFGELRQEIHNDRQKLLDPETYLSQLREREEVD